MPFTRAHHYSKPSIQSSSKQLPNISANLLTRNISVYAYFMDAVGRCSYAPNAYVICIAIWLLDSAV